MKGIGKIGKIDFNDVRRGFKVSNTFDVFNDFDDLDVFDVLNNFYISMIWMFLTF